MTERVDLSLALDLDEVRSEIQRRVDRVTAGNIELAAAHADLLDGRQQVLDKSAAAVAFVDAYLNPLAATPPPLVPEIAAPAPEVPPPVFTTVTEIEAAPVNTTGGSAAVEPTVPVVLPVEVPTEAAHAADPIPPELAAIVSEGVIAAEEHNAAIEAAAAEVVAAAEATTTEAVAAALANSEAVAEAVAAAVAEVQANPPVAASETASAELGGGELVQKAPKDEPAAVAAADVENKPGLAGDPVGKPEAV